MTDVTPGYWWVKDWTGRSVIAEVCGDVVWDIASDQASPVSAYEFLAPVAPYQPQQPLPDPQYTVHDIAKAMKEKS